MSRHFPPTFRPQRNSPRTQSRNKDYYPAEKVEKEETNPAEKTSLDITQRFERKLAEYSASDNVFKRWILEISCWGISALCMGAIVGIYVRTNGHNMSNSEHQITWVNALGKVAAAALIVPTSEALGQLKWNWFNKSRVMWDFEIFDKASRGPWGAVMLLFRTRGRSLAAFGAVLIVLLLAIDTFFQQVVEYPERWALSINVRSEMPRVVTYKPGWLREFMHNDEMVPTNRAVAAIFSQYFYENGSQPLSFGNGTRPDVPLSCPTSKCTWPTYETLAVCSRCEEVSQDLDISYDCLYTTIDWSANWTGPITETPYPNGTVCGYYINATSESPMLLSGYILDNSTNSTGEALITRLIPLTNFDTKEPLYGNGSVHFKNVNYPLLDGLIASVRTGHQGVLRNEAPDVHECMLAWCIQSIESSYEWGVYDEEVLSEYLGTPEPTPWPWDTYMSNGYGLGVNYSANIILKQPEIEATYSVDNDTVLNIILIFDDIFPSYYTAENKETPPLLRYKNYEGGPTLKMLDFNPWQAPNNLTRHMERLATSMTNILRSSKSKEMLYGDASALENYVSVKWAWLIFPFALLLLSLAFLVATMIKTSKDTATGIWKTSTMPALIYGLPEETRGKFAPEASWNGSSGDTKKVRIKLLPNLGWRVSGQSLLRSPLLPTRNQPPPGWI